MTKDAHAALEVAHAALLDAGEDDHAYEIETLISMFAPRKGDDPEVARARKVMNCICQNCGLTWPGLAMPAPVTDTAIAGMRLAKCARCFATEDIVLQQ